MDLPPKVGKTQHIQGYIVYIIQNSYHNQLDKFSVAVTYGFQARDLYALLL